MARGDSIFGRVDVDWFEGEKTSLLTPAQRDFYLNGLWLYAIKLRRDTIPASQARPSVVARNVHILRQSCARYMHKLDTIGLITINPDKSITVHGIKEVNRKIKWKNCPIRGSNGSPDFPHTVPYEDIDIREEEESLGSLLITSSPVTPTPDENPEGDRSRDRESGPTSPRPAGNGNLTREEFQAQVVSDPELSRQFTWEIQVDLKLNDDSEHRIREIVNNYPQGWINEAVTATQDKQQAIVEGTAVTPFRVGPLEYFAGILSNHRKAWEESL